jgi:hypothetical protein
MTDQMMIAALAVWATQNKDNKDILKRIDSETVDFNWQAETAVLRFRNYQIEVDCSSSPARINGSVRGEVRFSGSYISSLEVDGQEFSTVSINDPKKRITIDGQEFKFDL